MVLRINLVLPRRVSMHLAELDSNSLERDGSLYLSVLKGHISRVYSNRLRVYPLRFL